MPSNPFKPTAGKMPPILVGRETAIEEFAEGIDNGAGAPGRIMLVTGQRGYGKTVLLTEFRRLAAERQWETIAETASPGVVSRLIEALSPSGMHVEQATVAPSIGITGLATASIGQLNIASSTAPLTLRNAMFKRLESRKISKGKGILITIDETQAASRDDLVAIATAVQHVIGAIDETNTPDQDKKGIAIVFAGLPSTINDLVNDEVTTFLRRALRCELTNVPITDVKNSFLSVVAESNKTIGDDEALKAAVHTDGYPYMIQLIGYYMWQSAQRRHCAEITDEDVTNGIADASRVFDDAVCAPVLDGLTSAERLFVSAMVPDHPADSAISDIEKRTKRSRSWVNKYRASLIKNTLIRSTGYGRVAFAIPHIGEYLSNRAS
ncbi:ATP-binding protein [Bifidobacterium lemurum]|nr:ATP-binding protein [Bifidobacterium lemurum]QOL35058.1 ATP-binding protein [Bifidobacterium lemurum]